MDITVLAACANEKDAELAENIIKYNNFSAKYALFKIEDNGLSFLRGTIEPKEAETLPRILAVMDKESEHYILLELIRADVRKGLLQSIFQEFQRTRKDYGYTDIIYHTKCRAEILTRKGAIDAQSIDTGSFATIFEARLSPAEDVFWTPWEDVVYYYKKDERYSSPMYLNIEITTKCDLRCPKCQYHGDIQSFCTSPERNSDMDFEMLKYLMDQAAEFEKKPLINLHSGGENVLYYKFREAVLYAEKKGLKIILTTNGISMDKDLADFFLERENMHAISVSLDAMSPEIYEKMHGIDRYEKVVENLEYILARKKELGKKFPYVGLNCCLNKVNSHIFHDYFEKWKDKVDNITNPIIYYYDDETKLTLPPYTDFPRFDYPCQVPFLALWVDGSGRYFSCHHMPSKTPSVMELSLKDFWATAMEDLRSYMKGELESDFFDAHCKKCFIRNANNCQFRFFNGKKGIANPTCYAYHIA
ncbi:radical SAM protein [Limisalsivibrio acetivorans]|uniref:radical SAM protein n=1 Tax=Limisalsivibrio acetivorans TaxID=1304888 RepID=UPI0003B35E85|nr:radical SAM protein [Limisalsivibrio acetivorans]